MRYKVKVSRVYRSTEEAEAVVEAGSAAEALDIVMRQEAGDDLDWMEYDGAADPGSYEWEVQTGDGQLRLTAQGVVDPAPSGEEPPA